MLWEALFGTFIPRSGQSVAQIQNRELILNLTDIDLNFYSSSILLETSDIALKEKLIGIYFI